MNKKIERIARCVLHHGKILVRGLGRTAYSAMVAGLLGMAVMAFLAIPGEQGYGAVCRFLLGAATALVAMYCIYCSGGHGRRANKNK